MEREIEEALLPKEGEDPLDEETKQAKARRLRYAKMTSGFYAPEARAEYKKARKKEKKRFKKLREKSPAHQ